jgi:hypothetical protein
MQDKDEALRARAVKRATAKREFALHAVAYIAVNALLIVIWALSDDRGFFWPLWVLLGWGIGLAIHAAATYITEPSDAAIEKEMARLRR